MEVAEQLLRQEQQHPEVVEAQQQQRPLLLQLHQEKEGEVVIRIEDKVEEVFRLLAHLQQRLPVQLVVLDIEEVRLRMPPLLQVQQVEVVEGEEEVQPGLLQVQLQPLVLSLAVVAEVGDFRVLLQERQLQQEEEVVELRHHQLRRLPLLLEVVLGLPQEQLQELSQENELYMNDTWIEVLFSSVKMYITIQLIVSFDFKVC